MGPVLQRAMGACVAGGGVKWWQWVVHHDARLAQILNTEEKFFKWKLVKGHLSHTLGRVAVTSSKSDIMTCLYMFLGVPT